LLFGPKVERNERTKSPTVVKMGPPYRLYPKASVRLPVAAKSDFPE